MIARCGSELGVNLAISLHAVTDELRERVRSTHSMEEERALFDRLNSASSPEEQQQAVEKHRTAVRGGGKVELF